MKFNFQFPVWTQRRNQTQATTPTGVASNVMQQNQQLDEENQNDFTRNMQFLAMAGNMAGNLDWQTLLGMALGFGMLPSINKLFDRDKKKNATGANSMNPEAIASQGNQESQLLKGLFESPEGVHPRDEQYLDVDGFFKPETLKPPTDNIFGISSVLEGVAPTNYVPIRNRVETEQVESTIGEARPGLPYLLTDEIKNYQGLPTRIRKKR